MAVNEQQAVETLGLEVTIKSMQTAAADIEAQMKTVGDGIARAREEVSSVLDYFGEDPKRNPTEFFTTLASFCTVRCPYLAVCAEVKLNVDVVMSTLLGVPTRT